MRFCENHWICRFLPNLLTILNDVLDFSKIESRKLTLEAVPFALAEAMGDVLKLLAIRARQKGIELLYDVDPRTPLRRGFAIVRGPNGAPLVDPADAPPGTRLQIEVARGELAARVEAEGTDGGKQIGLF